MPLRQRLHLRSGAAYLPERPALTMNLAVLGLADASPASRSSIAAMSGDGLDADAPELALDPAQGLLCHRLEAGGWLARTLLSGDDPLLTREPLAFVDVLSRQGVRDESPLRLSRFAVLHDDGGRMVLSSGAAHARVVVHDPAVATLLARLSRPQLPADLVAAGDLAADEVAGALRVLLQARLLVRIDDGADPEREDQAQAQWDPVDLLFHASSRLGRRGTGYGGTYPHRDRFPEPVSRRTPGTGRRVPLPVPDLTGLAASDPSLTTVLEGRRSIRRHDDEHPITIGQLGELLHRTSRVRTVLAPEGFGDFPIKPYPSGGALYELDVYPVVRLCDGVPPAIYRYDGEAHELVMVAEDGPSAQGLLEQARVAALMDDRPQVLLAIAARFPRVSWKYEGMPYALTLKHVGVLYQTVYLVATAMEIAVCGLGGGDSDLFARAVGTDYYAETSVGEMIVGSRLPGDTGAGVTEVLRPTRSF